MEGNHGVEESGSRRDGIDGETEERHRIFGCELISEAGILLKLPQVVICTACNLVHQFYARVSLREYDAMTTAMGCFFLACKVEEKPKRIREVVFAFHYLWRYRRKEKQSLELGGPIYNGWKQALVSIERKILKELGFSFYKIDHAHKFILFYVKLLDGDRKLAQTAWSYLNDSTRLDLCLRYRSEVIACAAIYMAARKIQLKLPDTGESTWWQVFQVSKAEIDTVVEAILSLYNRENFIWLDPLTPNSIPRITDLDYQGGPASALPSVSSLRPPEIDQASSVLSPPSKEEEYSDEPQKGEARDRQDDDDDDINNYNNDRRRRKKRRHHHHHRHR